MTTAGANFDGDGSSEEFVKGYSRDNRLFRVMIVVFVYQVTVHNLAGNSRTVMPRDRIAGHRLMGRRWGRRGGNRISRPPVWLSRMFRHLPQLSPLVHS